MHDVDFVVAEEDADAAAKTLEEAGFRIDRPPEDWLFKACAGDVVVDVLHRLRGHLRSAVSYAGGHTLAEMRERIVRDPLRALIPLSEAARRESYER